MIIAFLFSALMINIIVGNSALDIHMHDTYFVFDPVRTKISLFLIVAFFILSLSFGIRYRFRNKETNISLLISLLLLISTGLLVNNLWKHKLQFKPHPYHSSTVISGAEHRCDVIKIADIQCYIVKVRIDHPYQII